MNLRKRTTVAHRARPSAELGYAVIGALVFGGGLGAAIGAMAVWQVDQADARRAQLVVPEGVLVIRHGTQIQRYVAAEPTILCPDGTVRPMSNYRHVCEPGWRQP